MARPNKLAAGPGLQILRCLRERFNKGGKAWILNKIPQNYGEPFRLHTLLNSNTPTVNGDDVLFSQAGIPEVDIAKLVYFALSIFWRRTRPWSAVEGGQPGNSKLTRICIHAREPASEIATSPSLSYLATTALLRQCPSQIGGQIHVRGCNMNKEVQTSFATEVSAQSVREAYMNLPSRVTGMPDLAHRCETATG